MNAVRDIVFEKLGIDSRYSGLDFIPRQQTVSLDAADYLAFALHHRALDPTSLKSTLTLPILEHGSLHGGDVPPEGFKLMLDEWKRYDSGDVKAVDIFKNLSKKPFFRGPK
jgi:hypothetical protein